MDQPRYRSASVNREGWDDLLAALADWAAGDRSSTAAAARTRQRWLARQAAEAASLAGVLLDLAERKAWATVETDAQSFQGQVVAAATALCVLRLASSEAALIALPRISAIITARTLPIGDRTPPLDLDLAGALAALAADRPFVRLDVSGGKRVAGGLESVGTELVVLHLEGHEGEAPSTALIPLDAVSACIL
jgi:hypothetical protein